MQQNTGRNTCSILVLRVSASYNPPLTPAKQLESPGHSQSPRQPADETGTHTCRAQLTNFRSWLNVREVAVEGLQRVRKQQGGKGSRSESLISVRGKFCWPTWKPGTRRAPSPFSSYSTYKVVCVHHQAFSGCPPSSSDKTEHLRHRN